MAAPLLCSPSLMRQAINHAHYFVACARGCWEVFKGLNEAEVLRWWRVDERWPFALVSYKVIGGVDVGAATARKWEWVVDLVVWLNLEAYSSLVVDARVDDAMRAAGSWACDPVADDDFVDASWGGKF